MFIIAYSFVYSFTKPYNACQMSAQYEQGLELSQKQLSHVREKKIKNCVVIRPNTNAKHSIPYCVYVAYTCTLRDSAWNGS